MDMKNNIKKPYGRVLNVPALDVIIFSQLRSDCGSACFSGDMGNIE